MGRNLTILLLVASVLLGSSSSFAADSDSWWDSSVKFVRGMKDQLVQAYQEQEPMLMLPRDLDPVLDRLNASAPKGLNREWRLQAFDKLAVYHDKFVQPASRGLRVRSDKRDFSQVLADSFIRSENHNYRWVVVLAFVSLNSLEVDEIMHGRFMRFLAVLRESIIRDFNITKHKLRLLNMIEQEGTKLNSAMLKKRDKIEADLSRFGKAFAHIGSLELALNERPEIAREKEIKAGVANAHIGGLREQLRDAKQESSQMVRGFFFLQAPDYTIRKEIQSLLRGVVTPDHSEFAEGVSGLLWEEIRASKHSRIYKLALVGALARIEELPVPKDSEGFLVKFLFNEIMRIRKYDWVYVKPLVTDMLMLAEKADKQARSQKDSPATVDNSRVLNQAVRFYFRKKYLMTLATLFTVEMLRVHLEFNPNLVFIAREISLLPSQLVPEKLHIHLKQWLLAMELALQTRQPGKHLKIKIKQFAAKKKIKVAKSWRESAIENMGPQKFDWDAYYEASAEVDGRLSRKEPRYSDLDASSVSVYSNLSEFAQKAEAAEQFEQQPADTELAKADDADRDEAGKKEPPETAVYSEPEAWLVTLSEIRQRIADQVYENSGGKPTSKLTHGTDCESAISALEHQ